MFLLIGKYFLVEHNYSLGKTDVFCDVLKSTSPYFSLNEKVNFNKNETKPKIDNPTHESLVLQLICKICELKAKLQSWSS